VPHAASFGGTRAVSLARAFKKKEASRAKSLAPGGRGQLIPRFRVVRLAAGLYSTVVCAEVAREHRGVFPDAPRTKPAGRDAIAVESCFRGYLLTVWFIFGWTHWVAQM